MYFLSDRTSLICYQYDTGKGRGDGEGKTRVVCVRPDTQFRIFKGKSIMKEEQKEDAFLIQDLINILFLFLLKQSINSSPLSIIYAELHTRILLT